MPPMTEAQKLGLTAIRVLAMDYAQCESLDERDAPNVQTLAKFCLATLQLLEAPETKG